MRINMKNEAPSSEIDNYEHRGMQTNMQETVKIWNNVQHKMRTTFVTKII
jgi:hypothetical protein